MTLRLAPHERAWLEAQDPTPIPRGTPTAWEGRLAPRSVIAFNDSLEAALEKARESDKLVYAVVSRYNPP